MNPLFILLALGLVIAQFKLPRQFAFLPLLIAICQFQSVAVVQVGVSFSALKLVIMAGVFKAMREQVFSRLTRNPLDMAVVGWAVWMLLSGFAHHPTDQNPFTIRLSVIFDFAGSYLYARVTLRNRDDFGRFLQCLAIAMIPLAVAAAVEKYGQFNIYGMISGEGQNLAYRGGKVRAAGPFGHPILCGTFAAGVVILLVPLWQRSRKWLFGGIGACLVTVLCSGSSGPIMTMFSGLLGVGIWRWRQSVGRIRTFVIISFVALHLMMQAPVWYLMARIDLAGGSTGWHRAELITTALNHLDEWWVVGTDYTRHWIPYGVPWSANHIDITNEYISMGVSGGLLLVFFFLLILIRAFQQLGRGLRLLRKAKDPAEFMVWCVGAALFAHCFTFISVSYFDQNFAALGLILGAVPGMCTDVSSVRAATSRPAVQTPVDGAADEAGSPA